MRICIMHGFPGGAVVKNLSTNTGDVGGTGLIPRSGRFPQEENGNPLQYVCLDNPTDRGTWRVTIHGGLKESDATEHTCT